MHGLSVIQYPSKRWGFVGRVPAVLAFEGSDEDQANAWLVGFDIAKKIAKRNGRALRKVAFDTRKEALAAAEKHGFEVNNR